MADTDEIRTAEGGVVLELGSTGALNNEKPCRSELKRDQEWLADSNCTDRSAKKQAKETSNDTKLETCGKSEAREVLIDVELENSSEDRDIDLEPCDKKLLTEASTDIELGACSKNEVKEALAGIELEHCAKKLVKESSFEMEPSGKSQLNIEQDYSAKNHENEGSNDIDLEPCDKMLVNGTLTGVEMEAGSKNEAKKALSDVELVPCAMKPVNEASNEDIEVERCPKNQVKGGDLSDIGLEPCDNNQAKEALVDIELECCANKLVNEASSDIELEPCAKKLMKEASNEDVCSEVSNPNVSPRENVSSFRSISSRSAELASNNRGTCGDITSTCSGSSSTGQSSGDVARSRSDALDTISSSQVVLEIPKHASTTGIRKITFKFSKHSEDYGKQFSASNGYTAYGLTEAPEFNPLAVDGAERKADAYEKGLHEARQPRPRPPNTEKVVPANYPTNVKKFLSTGILEGARVKYISSSRSSRRELLGIIKDYGYLCGCSICNFSKILSAHEFEIHAGGKSRHPNNHIYLENGKPIYSIIQELRTAPLSIVDEVIKDVAGSSVNDVTLQVWKGDTDAIVFVYSRAC
ncbi:hypothetical protein RJ639_029357 [Escallonia herrerae]|uniref:Tify domain-containing protein n=1 Tax=Escallonia herrerae TaxID=1293975 RepID=A0AA88X2V4_9ASTE|nr:hypothetical protein RJ639_029357 [Escallonia herrerae]